MSLIREKRGYSSRLPMTSGRSSTLATRCRVAVDALELPLALDRRVGRLGRAGAGLAALLVSGRDAG
jgi:hypothetical protein